MGAGGMSRHSIVRGRGVDYITSGREAGDDAADNLSRAAWCARNMVDHYQQRSMSEERDLWAAEYRELAEYLEASHGRLIARRAAAVVDEPPAPREPAKYECPCGLHIVDWSDDVEGFHDDIADHEATCDGLNEFERERERVDVDEETSPSFTCPRCGATSYNPNDAAEGYCGRCHAWTGSRFAPPAGRPGGRREGRAAGGKIPDVTPVTLECPGRDGFAHDWDDSYDCLACDAEQPVTMRYLRRGFSQAGLMSLVGAR
jgi:ribosomal protein S27AE